MFEQTKQKKGTTRRMNREKNVYECTQMELERIKMVPFVVNFKQRTTEYKRRKKKKKTQSQDQHES